MMLSKVFKVALLAAIVGLGGCWPFLPPFGGLGGGGPGGGAPGGPGGGPGLQQPR